MAVNENDTNTLAKRNTAMSASAKRLAKWLKRREKGQIGQRLEAGEEPILVVGRGDLVPQIGLPAFAKRYKRAAGLLYLGSFDLLAFRWWLRCSCGVPDSASRSLSPPTHAQASCRRT